MKKNLKDWSQSFPGCLHITTLPNVLQSHQQVYQLSWVLKKKVGCFPYKIPGWASVKKTCWVYKTILCAVFCVHCNNERAGFSLKQFYHSVSITREILNKAEGLVRETPFSSVETSRKRHVPIILNQREVPVWNKYMQETLNTWSNHVKNSNHCLCS